MALSDSLTEPRAQAYDLDDPVGGLGCYHAGCCGNLTKDATPACAGRLRRGPRCHSAPPRPVPVGALYTNGGGVGFHDDAPLA